MNSIVAFICELTHVIDYLAKLVGGVVCEMFYGQFFCSLTQLVELPFTLASIMPRVKPLLVTSLTQSLIKYSSRPKATTRRPISS
jgi:hypothetical protein